MMNKTNPLQKPASVRHESEPDYAKDAFYVTLLIQAAYSGGNFFKISFLQSNLIVGALIFAPAVVIVVARTWRSAFKYALLCTALMPALFSLLLVGITIVSFVLKPDASRVGAQLAMNIKISMMVWLLMLSAGFPGLILGALGRLGWNYFKRD